MFNPKRETMMKKFWNLMLAAMVIFGAAACNDVDVEVVTPEAGLSFEATIETNETRTDVVFNEGTKKWDTVWTGNETLSVVSGWSRYDFKNSVENKNHFVCTNDGVKNLVGNKVTIKLTHDTDGNTLNSKAGKAGGHIEATVDAFDPAEGVNLQVKSAFLRYSSDYEVTLDASAQIFDYNGQKHTTITLPAGEDVWVAIKTESDVTLSYTINGEKCKEKTLSLDAKKIYNLGELSLPYEVSAYTLPGTHNNWSTTATPMYKVGDYCVAFGIEFTASENKFKVLGANDNWLGVDNYTIGTWMTLANNTGDIFVAAGTYDIYFSESEYKLCVVAAGTEVPAMPVFSVGVVGLGGNWDVDKDMTLEGDFYTLKGVAVAATDSFKLRISDAWAENYGIASSTTADFVTIEKDTMYPLVQDGKNMQVAAGTYDLYFNYATKEFYALTPGTTPDDLAIPQYKIYVYLYNNSWTKVNLYSWDSNDSKHTGDWPGSTTTARETINGYEYLVWTMPRSATGASLSIILNDGSAQTADFALGTLDKDYYLLLNGVTLSFIEDKENPEPEVVQGEPQPSTWALAGDFNNWGELTMYTTDVTDLFVAKGVQIAAYSKIKVKKVGDWNTSYGAGTNYLNSNIWAKLATPGEDIFIVNAGKYDVYFDLANKRIYMMTEGADYTTATEQKSNGAAPDLSGASWGLCGTHNNWGSNDIKLEWDGTIGLYVAYNAKLTGEFKVRADNSWSQNYGCGGTITVDATAGKAMSSNGGNCKVASGTYDVYFDLSGKKIWVKTPGSAAPTK